MIYKTVKLRDIGKIFSCGTPSTKRIDYWNGEIPWITPKDLSNYQKKYISKGERNISEKGLKNSSAVLIPKGSILMSSRAPIGYVVISENELATNQGFKSIECNNDMCLSQYIYYWIKNNIDYIKSKANGSTFKEISIGSFSNLSIDLPSIDDQKKVISILEKIDKKIELNNQINNNLYEIVDNIYKHSFNNLDNFKRADEIADITIGKTPPRNIRECFTKNMNDVKWVSISDMGKCGAYIFNTNERLTKCAVEKYNVKIIPKETILLSFKLTLGRVAITTEDMTTNEAIAHFNLYNNNLKYYLFSYLKNYSFGNLGSTSSIATAVNSKIIKAISIALPNNLELENYNSKIEPLFKAIKINEMENETLSQLRDTLLPKLMNGEIDLENIEI